MDSSILNNKDDIKIDLDVEKFICRCCLTTERDMRDVVPYDSYFRELAGISILESPGLPQWLCWECSALLKKAVRFKCQILQAHNLLSEYQARCAPFPIDAEDPELKKYASPYLSVTNTLTYTMGGRGKNGFHDDLKHETKATKNETLTELPHSAPIRSVTMKERQTMVKIEDDVDYRIYDDDITLGDYQESQQPELLRQLLEGSSPIESKKESETKKKKKAKNKEREEKVTKNKEREERVTKRKKVEDNQDDDEPIRNEYEVDPKKIRIIKLDPKEQLRQKEEELKSKLRFMYQCHLCFQGFNFQVKLENHMKKHSPSRGPFECKWCHMYLPTAYSYEVHMLIHTQKYECVECGRRMTDKVSMLGHYKKEHEGIITVFSCNICGKISHNKRTHLGHVRNSHSNAQRPECDQCGKNFINKDALIEHLLIHQGIKNYECAICGMRFRTRAQTNNHQLKHTDAKNYYCVECDQRFKSAHCLRQHFLKSFKHKDRSSFKYACNRCEKRYETEKALREHTLIQHDGVRQFRCPLCPAALSSNGGLTKHVQSVHRGIKPAAKHVCDTCGKAFTKSWKMPCRKRHSRKMYYHKHLQSCFRNTSLFVREEGKNTLTNHIRTHTGEKPFECPQCGRGFSQRAAMNTHVRLVHMKIRRKAKVDPEMIIPELIEAKAQMFPKQEPWATQQPPSDVYFHIST